MSIFPTKIVLATDGSEAAELAATTAADLARSTSSELHAVIIFQEAAYVHPYYEVRLPRVAEHLRQQSQEEIQKVLDEQVERIRESGTEVAEAHLRTGEPDVEIVALAEKLGAGLIVLGSRGLGGVRRALMGSVADSVVRHAHCPVMVVHGDPVAFPTRILLAADGSKEVQLALKTAVDLAASTDSELHVVVVEELAYAYDAPAVKSSTSGFFIEANKRAREQLDAELEEVRSAGGEVAKAHLRVGKAAREIVALAEDIEAGLIVTGSRGREGIRRALMGSVSDSVARHAHCAVMVVRPHEADHAT